MSTTDELVRLIGTSDSAGEPAPDMAGMFLGDVVRAGVNSLFFTIGSYSEDLEFGPAPYPRPAGVATTPPRGTKVAVFFVEGDPGKPRVVCLYGWPE